MAVEQHLGRMVGLLSYIVPYLLFELSPHWRALKMDLVKQKPLVSLSLFSIWPH